MAEGSLRGKIKGKDYWRALVETARHRRIIRAKRKLSPHISKLK